MKVKGTRFFILPFLRLREYNDRLGRTTYGGFLPLVEMTAQNGLRCVDFAKVGGGEPYPFFKNLTEIQPVRKTRKLPDYPYVQRGFE